MLVATNESDGIYINPAQVVKAEIFEDSDGGFSIHFLLIDGVVTETVGFKTKQEAKTFIEKLFKK